MYDRLRTFLFQLDPERAHQLGMAAAGVGERLAPAYLRAQFEFDNAALQTAALGARFPNPIGLAAGFDKNAQRLPFWPLVGFGFVEVGSVSAQRSPGNPRPRAFRLEADQALINRMGLNNQGAKRIAARLARHRKSMPVPVGVNLAKTHDPSIEGDAAVQDFVDSFIQVAPYADYIALNISCPNTADGKTFESADALDRLLTGVMAARRRRGFAVPILVKMAPPYSTRVVFDSMYEDALAVCAAHGVDGFIAANTASDRPPLQTAEDRLAQIGPGGLSGRPIRERSTHLVRYLFRRTEGKVPIIGVGGVDSAEAAYEKIRAGASLVQLYTSLVYDGPRVVRTIKEGLVKLLTRDGFRNVSDAVGVDG